MILCMTEHEPFNNVKHNKIDKSANYRPQNFKITSNHNNYGDTIKGIGLTKNV